MKEKVLKTIEQFNLIESGDRIVIGVSGGPDSMCLLNILKDIMEDKNINLSFSICVAHINHKIRKEADEETRYVKEYCEKNNIPIYIKEAEVIKIAEEEKIGLEEAGRNVRYNFFEEVLKKTNSNKIAIAHNLNDRAETVLMNLIRGSGPLGLKGIEAKRNKYIRPLIQINRKQIEEYCEKEKLDPKFDKSNKDNTYTRNKIRNQLIPYLQREFNPNIIEAITKLSEIIEDEQNYLEKIVNNIYTNLLVEECEKEIILNLKEFNKQDVVIKRKLILYTINKLLKTTKNIEKIHIEDIIKLCNNNIGNKYLTPNKNIKVFIKKGKLSFISKI